MERKRTAVTERARRMYRLMPGATQPPSEDGTVYWGDVNNTPEWDFCERIAEEIETAKTEAMKAAGVIFK